MTTKNSSKKPEQVPNVILAEKEALPTDRILKTVLGETYASYRKILELTGAFDSEWKYYGKKYGWTLKIGSKSKALLYLTPQVGSFRVGFAVREKERLALLDAPLPVEVKEELLTAKKMMEGFPIRVNVTGRGNLKTVQTVIETLDMMRSPGVRR